MSDVINRTQRDSEGALLQQFSVDTNTIDPAIWVINPDLSALTDVPKYYWENTPGTEFIVEMNSDEKVTMDAWRLANAKTVQNQALIDAATAYQNTKYSQQDQMTLQLLYDNAIQLRPNRKAYLATYMNWLNMVATEVQAKQSAVAACTTIDDVNAVALDIVALDAADPAISVMGAMAVVDDMALANFLDANTSVTDPVTNVSGPFDLMQLLLMRTDLYNDLQNPLYHPGQVPVLGSGGFLVNHANRIATLESQVATLQSQVAVLMAK